MVADMSGPLALCGAGAHAVCWFCTRQEQHPIAAPVGESITHRANPVPCTKGAAWAAGRDRRPPGRPSRMREATVELTTKTWTVELLLSERDGITHAEARLHTGLPEPLTAVGEARLSPHDPVDVAEIP